MTFALGSPPNSPKRAMMELASTAPEAPGCWENSEQY